MIKAGSVSVILVISSMVMIYGLIDVVSLCYF